MTIAVCPGSFDPITFGHLDVIRRSAAMFDEVIVGVAKNATKMPLLGLETRIVLVRDVTADLENVRVAEVPALLAQFCSDNGAAVIVKGLRSGSDLDDELPMALMNRHLTRVETVFLPASQDVTHIASSLVKDVARHGGDISALVPPPVAAAVLSALRLGEHHVPPAKGHHHGFNV